MPTAKSIAQGLLQAPAPGPFSRWRERRQIARQQREQEQKALLQRSFYDLRGIDYSDFHSPRSMAAYEREKRLQRRVTWGVMSLVFIILGVARFL